MADAGSAASFGSEETDTGEEYVPPKLAEVLALFFAVFHAYEEASAFQKKRILKSFHQRLEGFGAGADAPTVFPSADSPNAAKAKAGFLGGVLYSILEEGMPAAMAELVEDVGRYPPHSRNAFFRECYMAGATDGDGSFCGNMSGDQIRAPFTKLAIQTTSNNPIALKALMRRDTGCYTDESEIRRQLNRNTLCGGPYFLANYLCLTVKFPQFATLGMTAHPMRQVASGDNVHTPHALLARRSAAISVSVQNTAHGVGFGRAWYRNRLLDMRDHRCPLLYNLSTAGWYGTDGGIRPGVELYQSNREYLEAQADVIASTFGCGRPTVSPKGRNVVNADQSPNARASFQMRCTLDQTAVLCIQFGSFDYIRRSHWLVVTIYLIVKRSSLPNKTAVMDFLSDLLSYIKKVTPS